ncbi:MAG: hypothetical protein JWM96_332 [Alphaproteobacteria bacterium]|nr:hypothetical protein [Alphaproteobacteria bacterium]
MSELTPKQFRLALGTALVLYGASLAGIAGWLVLNGEATLQSRLENAPQASVALPGAQTQAAPSSWAEPAAPEPHEMPPAEIKAEAPHEMPAEMTPHSLPEPEPAALPEPAPTSLPEASAPAKTPTWKKFARPFDQAQKNPRIALVVANLGLADAATKTAVQNLPGEVTLALSPLTPDLEDQMAKARAAGHEILLSMPMEPENYPQNDPGPNTLLLSQPDKENTARLRRVLASGEGYVGVLPFMGEKFVTSEEKMSPIMDIIREEGLMVLDNTGQRNSAIAPLSRLGKIPFTRSDVVVDPEHSGETVEAQLASLEKIAHDQGSTVGIIYLYPSVMEKLQAWIPTLEKKGLVLAPLTAQITQKE